MTMNNEIDKFIESYPQGYWQSGDKKFINKYQALLHGAQTNNSVHYNFFNSVWENFDRNLLGKCSLQSLYKKRAQQLRDKYDYLILYFSGGADSYNVLRSFLDNGIKLDEVCVKWCNDTLTANQKVYNPNQIEQSATNYLSEWDYAIKPVLDWLSTTHPTVKIEIVDWFRDRDYKSIEKAFSIVNHWHDVEVNSLAVWSPSELELCENGVSVGSIYGVDKPAIFNTDDQWFMYFPDGGAAMGTPNPVNVQGTEYFYWAHEMPILTFEMAYQVIEKMKVDKKLLQYAVTDKNRKDTAFLNISWQVLQKKTRHILYDNWTDRFQCLKPTTPDRSDKHQWIYTSNELENYKDLFDDLRKDHMKQISNGYYCSIDENINMTYTIIPSKRHLVCR
jgi:hypothetical protein